ncbi:MAG: response regulator transcription factor [Angelakisella sp.]|jgi:DNA-binding NarL/FixJ family response regulator|nr:response regulator transcription factor [Angelakisella sp.]MCI9529520.1 response regulator transcription factor [Angelakisella sp.]
MEGRKIQVMVAEDIPLLLEDFCDTVSRAGDMEIAGAALTGQEITRLAQERDCDVILMDIEMETMQAGILAAEAIHQRKPEVKIIFLTAHETEDIILSAMASGAVDYVVKGCEEEVLLEHIRKAYADEPALERHVQQIVMREYSRLHQSERSLIFFISNVARLTPAERELVRLLLQGLKVQEIAQARCVEVVTVKTQIKGLLNKFGCTRTKEIVALIRQMGLEHLFR